VIKHTLYLFCLTACILLTACASISRSIQTSANATHNDYPAASSHNPELDKPLIIDLSHYKSVQTRPHQRSDIAIAVATSGGGYRAANLTLGVLMGFEQIHAASLKGNFLQEIDYFSSVSGSGFGIGYYMTKLHNHLSSGTNTPFSLQNSVNEMLVGDSENSLRMDLTEHLFFGEDRGYRLERKLDAELLATPQGGLVLGDMFVPRTSRRSVELPYWATNATIYQNAAIFPFTPDIISRYRVTGYFHDGREFKFNDNFADPNYGSNMPVAVGLTASASVPFATPATTLTTQGCDSQCYLQLLDGGLSDNLGVYTALSLLLQDQSKIKILMIVDAYQGDSQPYSKLKSQPDNISLLMRAMTFGTDSNREHVKPNIRFVGRDLLCGSGASNVIVIYLDISGYPEAQKVGTQLTMSKEHQQLLIKIGQDLVAHNETLKTLIAQMNRHQLTLGQCHK
jgi:hypothetical protein